MMFSLIIWSFPLKYSIAEVFHWSIPLLKYSIAEGFHCWRILLLKDSIAEGFYCWSIPLLKDSIAEGFYCWRIPLLKDSIAEVFHCWRIVFLANCHDSNDRFNMLYCDILLGGWLFHKPLWRTLLNKMICTSVWPTLCSSDENRLLYISNKQVYFLTKKWY